MSDTTTSAPVVHKCERCHRPLTSAASIARRAGRSCYAKIVAAAATTDLTGYKAHQLASAAEALSLGAVAKLRNRVYLVVSTRGASTYRTALTGQCNCPAGLRGATCYHTAAVRILAAA